MGRLYLTTIISLWERADQLSCMTPEGISSTPHRPFSVNNWVNRAVPGTPIPTLCSNKPKQIHWLSWVIRALSGPQGEPVFKSVNNYCFCHIWLWRGELYHFTDLVDTVSFNCNFIRQQLKTNIAALVSHLSWCSPNCSFSAAWVVQSTVCLCLN